MAEANELVLEMGRAGSSELSAQLVRKTALKRVLKGERPRFVLAYGAKGSAQAQDFRLWVLQNWKKPKEKAGLAAASMNVPVVQLSALHWEKEVEQRVRTLGAADVVYFTGPGDPIGVPIAAKEAKELKSEDPLAAARARRDRILTFGRWYTAAEVAKLLTGDVAQSNPSQYASTLRRKGRLLGVLQKGEYLHPAFQFNDATGTLRRETAQLLRVLPKDPTGWGGALWCFQPTGRLRGRRPADVFATDAKAVIVAAKKDFKGDDGNW